MRCTSEMHHLAIYGESDSWVSHFHHSHEKVFRYLYQDLNRVGTEWTETERGCTFECHLLPSLDSLGVPETRAVILFVQTLSEENFYEWLGLVSRYSPKTKFLFCTYQPNWNSAVEELRKRTNAPIIRLNDRNLELPFRMLHRVL